MLRRIGFSLLALVAIALGLVVGTFNAQKVSLDLLWIQLDWPLGLILLCAFVAGLGLGLLLVNLVQVIPLKLKLRKLTTGSGQVVTSEPPGDDA
jgi:uncharacterized integral membrane protein